MLCTRGSFSIRLFLLVKFLAKWESDTRQTSIELFSEYFPAFEGKQMLNSCFRPLRHEMATRAFLACLFRPQYQRSGLFIDTLCKLVEGSVRFASS